MTSGERVILAWLGMIAKARAGWLDLEPPASGKSLGTVDAAGKEWALVGRRPCRR